VGLPVYKGADLVAKALDCLRRQTFGNFEAIISVDGNDAETAAACRPFLVDSRFRMVVHSERLDWVGNFNWLLRQDLQEFFCYRQHDDTTAPEFFEALLQAADSEPNAAAIYCDCQYSGRSNRIEIARSIRGVPLDRMLEFIERIPHLQGPPIRGLIRRAAIHQAGLVKSDEFRAPLQMHGWLAKLLCWGSFRRVGEPLYYRLDRADSFTSEYIAEAVDRKRAEWTTLFTGLLEAAMPLCRTPQERLFFQQIILGRIVAYPNFRQSDEPNSSARLITECLERLRYEGNTHLLKAEELPLILQELHRRLDEIKLSERSRMEKGIYQIRLRYRFGKLVYPKSPIRRLTYQIRHLLEMLGKVGRLFAC
jgi:glycosyltransferase involved in cell wall biosynthesis